MIEKPLYMFCDIQVAAAVGLSDPHAGEVPVVFVQLQQGSGLTKEQIFEHLKKGIGERAAMPKEIFILDEIPLTPNGKIFKPALRKDAIKFVYLNEINALVDDIKSLLVDMGEDRFHGVMAKVEVKKGKNILVQDLEERIKEVLTRYTIKYELSVT